MTSFIAELKRRLPEADWPMVVGALRNQDQVWAELQSSELGAQALETAGGQREKWSPGFLGLLRLGQTQQFDKLLAEPMQAVSEKLRYQAAAAYEKLAVEGVATEKPDLEQATLLALALRERRRLLNGWDQLTNDLSIASAEFWKLPMASLFGLMPNPQEILSVLLGAGQSVEMHELAIHTLITNPLRLDEQSAHLLDVVASFELPKFLSILRVLASVSAPLAKQAALQALENLQGKNVATGDAISEIEGLLLQAEIHQIGGNQEESVPLLSKAWETVQQFQNELAEKLMETAGDDDSVKQSVLQKSNELFDVKSFASNGNGKKSTPYALVSAAQVALNSGDKEEATKMAKAALQAAQKGSKRGRDTVTWMRKLSQLLIDLKLYVEALTAASYLIEDDPNDAENAALYSHSLLMNGEHVKALEAAHLAAALAPDRVDLRRNLAKALQAGGETQDAMQEWQALLAHEATPSKEDLIAFAECALANGHNQTCIEACQQVLAADPTNGNAHTLIGKALLVQGDEESATQHLQRATQLAPNSGDAWLALAQQQRTAGYLEEARSILLNALQFAQPSGAMHSLLAEVHLTLEQREDALAEFKRAAELTGTRESKLAVNIALQIAALEVELGQIEQARHTLEQAHRIHPANAEIARPLGKALLAFDPKGALAALQVAELADPENPDILLDIARAQLAIGGQAAEAEKNLRKALSGKGAAPEARALLAQALAAQEKYAEANKQFDAALQSGIAEDPNWKKKLVLGKAVSQAALGEKAAAIATLEEMDKAQPGDLEILRALCAAYKKANRGEEALQIAQKVYLQSPKDEASALWYAEQAEALGKAEEARKALSKAAKANSSPALAFRLAELQWLGESQQAAKETLAGLLKNDNASVVAKAGHFLLARGAARDSVRYFKRVLDMNGGADLSMYEALTRAYVEGQQPHEALEMLDKSIALAPNNPHYLSQKADILQMLGRPQAALEILERALEMLPESAELIFKKAQLLLNIHDWGAALDAAEKAFGFDPSKLDVLKFAVELAVTLLQPERARAMLEIVAENLQNSFELVCLNAELALDANEEIKAAKALAPALETHEGDPRVLAMQARLAARRGDHALARQTLQKALNVFSSDPEKTDGFTLHSLARAAQRLNDWGNAIDLLQTWVKRTPTNSLAQFSLGRALLLRGEWEQLNQAVDAAFNATAFSQEAYAACKQALTAARNSSPFAAAQALIERWMARAELRFAPKVDFNILPKSYPASGGEAAALFFAARRSGELVFAEERGKSFLKVPEVLIERALALAEENASEALKLIEQAADLAPTRAQIHALAARLAEQLGDAEDALEHIANALALWPQQARWQAFAGELHKTVGGVAEAVEHFSEAIALQPNEPSYYFNLGQAQLAVQAFGEAIQSFQQAIKLLPKEANYLLALAEALRQSGDLKQARKHVAEAQKLAPNMAATYLLQAELALQSEEAEQAKSFIEQGLKLAPKDVNALRIFAECLNALGKTEDASAVLDRAADYADDVLPILVRRARLLTQNAAIEELVKLSQKFPDRAEVFFALSEVLAVAGNFKDAINAAQRAVKRAAESMPRDVQARLHLHLGQLLKHGGQLDQALHHLAEAVRMAPYLLEAHLERGRVFQARRQFEQALQAFREAAGFAPDKAQPHLEAALALKEAKDYSAAEAELRAAAKLAPKDRVIQKQLAAVIALNMVHQPQKTGMNVVRESVL